MPPVTPPAGAYVRGMSYLGSKARIAPSIANVITRLVGPGREVVEPFMGGGNMTTALILAGHRVRAFDVNASLIAMWDAAIRGDVAPFAFPVPREEYDALKRAPDSARRGFVGFAASFGSKWFAGYAPEGRVSGTTIHRPHAGTAKTVATAARVLADGGAAVACRSYDEVEVPDGAVVYCDPPYAGTTGYRQSVDHAAFWRWARALATRADVFVSEYAAPDEWEVLADYAHRTTVGTASGANTGRAELLFYLGPRILRAG